MKNTKIFIAKALSVGFLFIFSFFQSFSQTKTVTGTVSDAKDGSPIAGATVQPKGSRNGTSTGADGSFSIVVGANVNTLVVSFVGYTNQEVKISGTTANVSMLASNANLNEVVVVGYGTARKKDLTGSVASVKAKDFNQGIISSPDELLQNKVAGLEITNTSGQPGVATTIQIRGNSSIRSSNNPLFVVDGVPLDGSSARPNVSGGFGNTPSSDPLLFIDPNSIASIDVLKDASSSAIYGARGANGVIAITTKKGSAGPMRMDVGVNFGVNLGYMKRFDVLTPSEYRSALTKYGEPATLDGKTNTDALKAITQHGLSQNYSLAFSGGNEVGKFRASFLGSKQVGFIKKTGLDKFLGTIGGTYKFIDNRLTLDFNVIAGNYGEQLTSVSNDAGSAGNIISSALSWNPTVPLRNADGTYNFPSNGSGNPLAFNDAYNDRSSVNSYLANISASFDILKNLQYKFLFGVNHGTGIRRQSVDGWIQGQSGISGVGLANIADARLLSQTFTHTLNYNANIAKDLSLTAVVGYEYFKSDYSGDGVSASGYNTNLTQGGRTSILYTSTFQDAKTINPYFTYVNPTTEIQSYFGRVTLNYKDKYLLNGSLRSDGSSKFGSNNKYGYFPAIGGRWVVSNENFMKDSRIFSNFAFRASYGITGNQEFPAGSSQEQFSLSSYNNAPQVVNGNPNLKWESDKSIDIGTDFSILHGKVYFTIDYYNRTTSDILFQTTAIQPAPSSVSFVNLPNAKNVNSGVEFAVGASLVNKKSFGWDINFNIAYNKNMVKDFKDPNTGLNLLVQTGFISGQGVSGTLAQVFTNNQPVSVYYLKPFLGFDQSGNQKIGDNPTFAGDPNPKILTGLSTTLRYNKFSLIINAGGSLDFKIYNNTATSVTNISGIIQGRNIDKAAYNSAEQPTSGVGASTRFLENGSYVKLRNATLRYQLGGLGKYGKNVSAFVSGSNLFVITKFTGFDPEVNIDKSNNSYPSRSIEYVPYPTPRVLSFGVNFTL